MTASPHLGLGYLAPAQAQKHVTVNEALRRLDALVQLGVLDRTRTAPPADPQEGDRHIVGAGATGVWAGQDGRIAAFLDGAWAFVIPKPGWLAYVAAESLLVVRLGGAWTSAVGGVLGLDGLQRLGVATSADAVNRFAVASPAALFTHAGAGVQAKLNKATAADTASLLLQTGFSGRAEVGLAGSDDLTIKTSPDGAAWTTALTADAATGLMTVAGDPTAPLGIATRRYAAAKAGDTVTGPFTFQAGATFGGTVATNRFVSLGDDGAVARRFDHDGLAVGVTLRNFGVTAAGQGGSLGEVDLGVGGAQTGFAGGVRVLATDSFATAATASARLSVTLAAAGAAVAALDVEATGELYVRGQRITTPQGCLLARGSTLATLPTGAVAGQLLHCADLGGGGGLLAHDGAQWRRASGGGHQTVAADANLTLTALASAEEQRWTATLAADRTIALSAANAYPGARFRVTRTGAGAFGLSVGGLKTLGPNSWCEVAYDGAAWRLAACGTL